ncbi:hypothetical protein Salmi_Mp091 (mitochondrion) [Salvia miltiorrhiza]|uniref:Uncharacterized protein n=1 Tax=Salvia miltiorrhiza TaxID=226208 RepID=V9P587_SALMI|nr:hypothetical protein Salmi_Mp091 [Salvia miltiorrhiza]AGU16619.1 hypothetical protein Salmi_Mp091 [Salvia miltiorrhiza]
MLRESQHSYQSEFKESELLGQAIPRHRATKNKALKESRVYFKSDLLTKLSEKTSLFLLYKLVRKYSTKAEERQRIRRGKQMFFLENLAKATHLSLLFEDKRRSETQRKEHLFVSLISTKSIV